MDRPYHKNGWGVYRVVAAVALLAGLVVGSEAVAAATTRPATRPSTLPVIELGVSKPIAREKKVPCTARVVVDGEEGEALAGEIRTRGASSSGAPKQSYLLELEKSATLLGIHRRQWILNAAYIDRSLMRHKLAYDLFRSLSAPGAKRYAARSRFVELTLNGSYEGVYLLMERVDRKLLNLPQYSPEDAEHACLFKARNHDAGYAADHRGYEQEEPEPGKLAYFKPLDALLGLVHNGSAAAVADPRTGIAAQLDLDNTIDFHLLVLVTGNTDGITKNYSLARKRPTPEKPRRFFFVPWDYDGSFGRNWDSSRLPHELWISAPLFDRLWQDPAYRKRFGQRWAALRAKQFSTATVVGMIDANAKELAGAAARNAARWPTNRPPYHDRISFEQDVAQMKEWTAAHLAWLDGFIQQRAK